MTAFKKTALVCMAASLLLLQGCSSISKTQHPLSNWGVSGKIGVTTPKESVAGFIEWQQLDNNFDVYVSGPLSVGSTRIKGNAERISITQNGKTVSGLNPQKLIYEQLGWFFPVQNLPFWIKGQTAPYSAADKTEKDGRIATIKQDNWLVAYPRYNEYYDQPSKIKISQGQWKFLIVIKNWTFDS